MLLTNNAIIECITRATPVFVNSLPSVREYLGDGYPLYYETMEEAAAKASDASLCRELAESEIYQSLPL